MIPRFSSKPWTQRLYVHLAQRINNSYNGNPQWILHVGLPDVVTTVLRTEPDAQIAHEDLTAYEGSSPLITIIQGNITDIKGEI